MNFGRLCHACAAIGTRLSRMSRAQRSMQWCAADPGSSRLKALEIELRRPQISAAPVMRCTASGERALRDVAYRHAPCDRAVLSAAEAVSQSGIPIAILVQPTPHRVPALS